MHIEINRQRTIKIIGGDHISAPKPNPTLVLQSRIQTPKRLHTC